MLLVGFHNFNVETMGGFSSVTLHVAILGFLIAAVTAVVSVFQPRFMKPGLADRVGLGSAVLLALYFIARFIEAGSEPLENLFEVVLLSALFLALVYFIVIRVKPMAALGAFAFPGLALLLAVDLLIAPGFGSDRIQGSWQSGPGLLVLHVLATVLSFGALFMAAVASLMFLVQERTLKRHKDPKFLRSFPSLEALRKLVNTCVFAGLLLLSLGLALGFMGFTATDWREIGQNPKVATSLLLWFVLALAAVGRLAGVLHGRRHYYLVLVGFLLVIVTYIGLGVRQWRRQKADNQLSSVSLRPGLAKTALAKAGYKSSARAPIADNQSLTTEN